MARGGFGGSKGRSGGMKSGVRSGSHSTFHSSHGIGSRGHIGSRMGSHFGHHHHRHYGGRGRGMVNPGQTFETQMDAIVAKTGGPTIANGVVTFEGSQVSVMNHLNTIANSPDVIVYLPQPVMMYENSLNTQMSMMDMQNQMAMQNNPMNMPMQDNPMNMPMGNQMNMPMMNQMNTPMPNTNPLGQMMSQPQIMMVPQVVPQSNNVTEVHITVVGNKTVASDLCCFVLTIVLGSFCLFPLLFMCCAWWKKIIYPKYDLDAQFYRALGRYLRKEPHCRVLVLKVADNGFNAQKAKYLGESLAGTSLTGFTFVNMALECNYLANQADEFRVNMVPIKSLPFTSSVTWGDMIL